MKKDWRLLREQEKYLHGVTLIRQTYEPVGSNNDHDHCEFCMSKFEKFNFSQSLVYCTEDKKIWICNQCYEDFKNLFSWTIKSDGHNTGDGSPVSVPQK